MTSAERLRLANLLTEPAIRGAIAAMDLPPGSRGIDVGCGIGQHALWLAEAAGEGSRVVGIDLSAETLEAAREVVAQSPLGDRVELERHNLLEIDHPDDTFDWAWCADTLWPMDGMEPIEGLAELARVVRPGGQVGLAFWSSQQLLSGHPAFEARLQEMHVRRARYLGGIEQRLHFMRALGWMQEVGLIDAEARTFVANVTGPLRGLEREALGFWFDMFWSDLKGELSSADWTYYLWLCDLVSASFVGDLPDYYGFITYTLFRGTVPGK